MIFNKRTNEESLLFPWHQEVLFLLPFAFFPVAHALSVPLIAFPVFFASMFSLFFLPWFFLRRPSSFERSRTVLQKYFGSGWLEHRWNRSWITLLLLYSDGIEYRIGYDRYFFPFNEIRSIECKDRFFGYPLRIECRLPRNPWRLGFSSGQIDEISETIKSQWERHKGLSPADASRSSS